MDGAEINSLADLRGKFSTDQLAVVESAWKSLCSDKDFVDEHKTVSKSKFAEIYADKSDFTKSDPQRVAAEASLLFDLFDSNANGELDYSEFLSGILLLGTHSKDERITATFERFDLNKDGFIDRDEMRQLFRVTVFETGFVALRLLGHSEDEIEYLRPEPAVVDQYIEEECDRVFSVLDTNGDGLISREEFIEGARKHGINSNLAADFARFVLTSQVPLFSHYPYEIVGDEDVYHVLTKSA